MAYDSNRPVPLDQYRLLLEDAMYKPFTSTPQLALELRSLHPGGVHAILIGLMSVPRFKSAPQGNGIIAILIGLLVPAVQKLSTPGSPDLRSLQTTLVPGGSIGVATGDGSVRVLAGPPRNWAAIRG